MKKHLFLTLIIALFLCITAMPVTTYAAHNTITGQSDGADAETSKTLKDAMGDIVQSDQSKWFTAIPDDILPGKIKIYITSAVRSYTLFAAIILVINLVVMAYGSMDEQQLRFSKKALTVLLTSILIANMIAPLIHLGLWMAGAI